MYNIVLDYAIHKYMEERRHVSGKLYLKSHLKKVLAHCSDSVLEVKRNTPFLDFVQYLIWLWPIKPKKLEQIKCLKFIKHYQK